jgi:hypothetical protein
LIKINEYIKKKEKKTYFFLKWLNMEK